MYYPTRLDQYVGEGNNQNTITPFYSMFSLFNASRTIYTSFVRSAITHTPLSAAKNGATFQISTGTKHPPGL